jgi:hypothetical protein
MAAAIVSVYLLHGIEEEMRWQSSINPSTAQAVLGTMASSMFTFMVFVSSALLIAVQLASTGLSVQPTVPDISLPTPLSNTVAA